MSSRAVPCCQSISIPSFSLFQPSVRPRSGEQLRLRISRDFRSGKQEEKRKKRRRKQRTNRPHIDLKIKKIVLHCVSSPSEEKEEKGIGNVSHSIGKEPMHQVATILLACHISRNTWHWVFACQFCHKYHCFRPIKKSTQGAARARVGSPSTPPPSAPSPSRGRLRRRRL